MGNDQSLYEDSTVDIIVEDGQHTSDMQEPIEEETSMEIAEPYPERVDLPWRGVGRVRFIIGSPKHDLKDSELTEEEEEEEEGDTVKASSDGSQDSLTSGGEKVPLWLPVTGTLWLHWESLRSGS